MKVMVVLIVILKNAPNGTIKLHYSVILNHEDNNNDTEEGIEEILIVGG